MIQFQNIKVTEHGPVVQLDFELSGFNGISYYTILAPSRKWKESHAPNGEEES